MHDRIVLVPRMSVDAQWLSLSLGAMEASKSSGTSLFRSGPSDDADVRTQIALMNRAIDAQARGVVVYPITLFTMERVIQEAVSQRIPVVVLVAPIGIPPSDHLSYVLTDEDEGARAIAEQLVSSLGVSGDVLLIGISPQAPGVIDRADKIEEAIRRVAPQIQIAQKIADTTSSGFAEQEILSALQADLRIRSVISLNARMGAAAASAVERLGSHRHVAVIAYGQSLQLFLQLRRGEIDGLLVQDMRRMGRIAVENINSDRSGEPYAHTVSVKPYLVTRDNIDSAAIQRLVLMHGDER